MYVLETIETIEYQEVIIHIVNEVVDGLKGVTY